jgi:porphobilinogen deaminase
MAQSAIIDEVLRKLDYVEKIANEAKELLADLTVNPGNYEIVDQLQQQSEIINLLLDQLRAGKTSGDQFVESKFKQIGRKYLDMKRAELALEVDELDLDVVDSIRNKDIPRARRR